MSSLQFAPLLRWKELQEKCSREGCGATGLRNSLMARRGSIRIAGKWYCGSDCFRKGLEFRIGNLHATATHRPAQRASRIPLGLLMVSRGCITRAQLAVAREQQSIHGGTIADVLCGLRFASERQVADAMATQWGCPVYSAKLRPHDIGTFIPTALLRSVAMAPVFQATRPNRLLIGFVRGVEHRLLRAIEEMTSCLADPCFITARDCEDQIRGLSGRNTEVTFERQSSPEEMANIVQSYADQIGADEVRLASWRNYIWVRLQRQGHPTDLLFALSLEDERTIKSTLPRASA